MPAIPGVPTLEPVKLPYMSPEEAGRPGEDIARLATEDTGIALGGLELQAHIKRAQGQVDRQAAGNQLEALWTAYQDDLRKTTDSRDVDGLKAQWQQKLNELAKQWGKSPDAIQIQLMADSYRPSMDHIGQVRQVDLMGKEWEAQTTLQVQKMLPQYVAAMRAGDTAAAKSIVDNLGADYDEAIKNSLKTPSDKQIGINAFQISARKDLNEAIINSANPAEREQAIEQLRAGGKGPLDLTQYTPGDVAASLGHAEETDKRLTSLSESRNENAILNNMDAAFSFPEYKGNWEGQLKALQDPEFLKRIGATTPDGQPNRIMAEKLQAEVDRQRSYALQQQTDVDNKALDQFGTQIDENKMSLAQINEIHGISDRARRALVGQWRTNWNINRQIGLEERQEALRARDEASATKYADVLGDMAEGKEFTPAEIRMMPELTSKDKTQLLLTSKSRQDDPNYAAAMDMLNDTLPRLKAGTPDQLAQRDLDYRLTQQQFQQRVNENPKEDKAKVMRDVLEPAVQKDIASRINQILGIPPAPPTFGERLAGVVAAHPTAAHFLGIPQPPADKTTPATPKEGDKKKNSAGDPLVYKGGAWQLDK